MTSNEQLDLETGLQRAIDLYHQTRATDAIQTLMRLGRKFPDSAKLWGYLGFLYREINDPLKAAQSFRKAVKLSPKSERASLGLFFALWQLRKFSEALKEMGRFALTGETRDYLKLFSGASSEKQLATKPISGLLEAELMEAEATYLETEAHPEESLTEIHDRRKLRELIDA